MEKRREKMKEMAMAPIQARLERSSMQGLFELFFPRAEAGRLAELATAIKFNLPLPKKGRKARSAQTESNRVKPSQSGDNGLTTEGRDASQRRPAIKPDQNEESGLTVNPGRDSSAQTETNRGRLGEASLPCESEQAGQTESNQVKPSQSENTGLTVKAGCADGVLESAT